MQGTATAAPDARPISRAPDAASHEVLKESRSSIDTMLSLAQSHWRHGFVCVASLVLAVSCATTNDYRVLSTFSLRPGAHLEDAVGVSVSPIATVHKGRTRCAHEVMVGDVAFSVDVRCGTTRILSVRTSDPKFATSEGVAIGHDIEAVKQVAGARLLPDGEVQLPSGWVVHAGSSAPPSVISFTSPEGK
jgi:hypothetical protein